MSSPVRRVPVDEDLLALMPGGRSVCAFALRTSISATPEQWARALFDGPPALWRTPLWVGWRFGLGLRLGPRRAPDRVQGWTIESRGPDAITLGAESRLMSARNVVRVSAGTVTWTTLVGSWTRLGRLLWGAAAPVHHASVPILLTRARPLQF